ncbi:ATP-binding protein [Serratia ureilytica]
MKIEPREFSCLEVITHIAGNYLPLVVKKRLGCTALSNRTCRSASSAIPRLQVLSNPVNNAIKFTDTGCIVLQVCTRGSYLEFSVRDTGVGIPEKEISRLFDPFFPWGPACSVISRGTGPDWRSARNWSTWMDGDVRRVRARAQAALFSIRIPLFNAQFPIPQASDTPGRGVGCGWISAISGWKATDGDPGGYGADIQRYDGRDRRGRGCCSAIIH